MSILPNIGNVGLKDEIPREGIFLYHPDHPTYKRVTKEDELELAKKEGWSTNYVHKDLPRMMHHPIPEQNRVATTPEEVKNLIEAGYEFSPSAFTEKRILEAKIKDAEATLRDLRNKTKELDVMKKAG